MNQPANHAKSLPNQILLWGGTGQAKVLRPMIEAAGSRVVAVVDDTVDLAPPFSDVPLLHGKTGLLGWLNGRRGQRIGFSIAIGNPHGGVRLRLHDLLVAEGLEPVTLIHPSAVISSNAVIGTGSQVLPGAIVMPEARIGRHCIINTKASVDHECILGDGVEIGPGATLCGNVTVGERAWVCAGATVLPRVRIGADAILGAGALARSDIPSGATYVGVPARPLARRSKAP